MFDNLSTSGTISASTSDIWSVLEVVIPFYRPNKIDKNFLLEVLNECIDTWSQETWIQDVKDYSRDFVISDDL